jgi:CRISPR-associated protein Cst2
VEYLARKKKIKKEGIMNNNELKNITITMVFDGSALNRDEKVGGNILSIKKLNVNGEIRSFIGKPAIRHYLFQTLWRANHWAPAPTILRGSRENKTLQFDITKADILSCAELDLFGFMFTIEGERAITRKAPLGITKAVSLQSYDADLAFYANHDLVERHRKEGFEVNPSPYSKEEHSSFYKASFTVDSKMVGADIWVLDDEPKVNGERKLELKISSDDLKVIEGRHVESNRWSTEHGTVWWEKTNDNKWKVHFELTSDAKRQRIRQVMDAIASGLFAQSSGEANTIIPLFLVAAPVKVPSPVFHPYIDVRKEDGQWKVIGVKDALKNSWIDGKVYVFDCERLKVSETDEELKELSHGKVTRDWNELLKDIGITAT